MKPYVRYFKEETSANTSNKNSIYLKMISPYLEAVPPNMNPEYFCTLRDKDGKFYVYPDNRGAIVSKPLAGPFDSKNEGDEYIENIKNDSDVAEQKAKLKGVNSVLRQLGEDSIRELPMITLEDVRSFVKGDIIIGHYSLRKKPVYTSEVIEFKEAGREYIVENKNSSIIAGFEGNCGIREFKVMHFIKYDKNGK